MVHPVCVPGQLSCGHLKACNVALLKQEHALICWVLPAHAALPALAEIGSERVTERIRKKLAELSSMAELSSRAE